MSRNVGSALDGIEIDLLDLIFGSFKLNILDLIRSYLFGLIRPFNLNIFRTYLGLFDQMQASLDVFITLIVRLYWVRSFKDSVFSIRSFKFGVFEFDLKQTPLILGTNVDL